MADLVGLSQGLNSNTGGVLNTLSTLGDIKNKQEVIALEREKQREQARRWNEEFALTSRMGEADIAYKEQQTAELNQKVQTLTTQNEQMNKQLFTTEVGQQFWGGWQAQDFNLFNKSLANSEQGQQLAEFFGGRVESVGAYSTQELRKYNSDDAVRDAVLNPKGYVVLGVQEKKIIPIESFLALTGLSQSYNAQQLSHLQQMERETSLAKANIFALDAKTPGDLAQANALTENVGNPQQMTILASQLDKNQAAAQQAEQKALANKSKVIDIPLIREGAYAGIASELQKLSQNNYAQSQLASITTELKQRIWQDAKQLEEKVGHPPSLNEIKAMLGKDADVILGVLQANDPYYKQLSKVSDPTRLLGAVKVNATQIANTLTEDALDKRKDGQSITDFLDTNAPFVKPAFQYFNSLFGGRLESDEQFIKNTTLQAQLLGFSTSYLKYLSGVAARPDEFKRTQDMYGSFGKSSLEQITLLKNFIDGRLRELQAQKAKDPASFMLYQSDDLAEMQQLYNTVDILQRVKISKNKAEQEQLLKQLHNNTAQFVKREGLAAPTQTSPQATPPVTPAKTTSQASNVVNLTLKQKAPTSQQTKSNLTQEQQNALDKGW